MMTHYFRVLLLVRAKRWKTSGTGPGSHQIRKGRAREEGEEELLVAGGC